MIIINTAGGSFCEWEGSFEELQLALSSSDCKFLVGTNDNGGRVLIPCKMIDSVEEVNADY